MLIEPPACRASLGFLKLAERCLFTSWQGWASGPSVCGPCTLSIAVAAVAVLFRWLPDQTCREAFAHACHVLLAGPPSGQDGHSGLPVCLACAAGAVLLLQPPPSHAVSMHKVVCSIGNMIMATSMARNKGCSLYGQCHAMSMEEHMRCSCREHHSI